MVDTADLERMGEVMQHRGPDDSGHFVDGNFGMAMRRLSIIDLSGGHQPLRNEDGTILLILNGEIYNHIELRADLEGLGHRFRSRSDAEVLIHLYEEFGTDGIQRLNGMFAFCLWDQKRHMAWLGRDRLGIKPLVYYKDDHQLSFASTLDAITALPGFSPEIDREAFLLFLTLAYVPAPRALYRGIRKLPPGHWMTIREGQVHLQRYWELRPTPQRIAPQEFEEGLLDLLKSSIVLHSRSDVPVGSLLSGGLDSSAVTALFREQAKHSVHTFSIGFVGKPDSELGYAKELAARYQTVHHEYEITALDSLVALEELIPYMDEPVTDSAVIPSYIVSKKAREWGVTVTLCGAGGDEIYGGYERHFRRRRDFLTGRLGIVPFRIWESLKYLQPRLLHYGLHLWDKGVGFALETSGIRLEVLRLILRKPGDFRDALELLREQFRSVEALEKQFGFAYARMLTDLTNYLPDNVLSLLDKASMAASVEARVPLLDHRLVEFSFAAAAEVNVGVAFADAKSSFKRAVAGYIPASILQRDKAGFNAPVRQWVNTPAWKVMHERIATTSNPVIEEYFDQDRLSDITQSEERIAHSSETLFMLYVFDKWAESHFRR